MRALHGAAWSGLPRWHILLLRRACRQISGNAQPGRCAACVRCHEAMRVGSVGDRMCIRQGRGAPCTRCPPPPPNISTSLQLQHVSAYEHTSISTHTSSPAPHVTSTRAIIKARASMPQRPADRCSRQLFFFLAAAYPLCMISNAHHARARRGILRALHRGACPRVPRLHVLAHAAAPSCLDPYADMQHAACSLVHVRTCRCMP